VVKNKLHIIGCSFSTHGQTDLSNYPNDPTNYARVLATLLDLEPVAHARIGQGNSFIYETLKDLDPGADDTVLIQLTQPDRKKAFLDNFGTVKMEELYNPAQSLLTELDAVKEDVITFASLYDKFFTNNLYEHDLYCDAILSICVRLNINCIVLPLHNKTIFSSQFSNFDNIKFGSNPWHKWDFEKNGNPRNDHLTTQQHQELAQDIYNESV